MRTFADGAELHLYRVSWKVRPTPRNPAYFMASCGLLFLYLLDDSMEPAVKRALGIAGNLPFELVGPHGVDEWVDAGKGDPVILAATTEALGCGFSWHFVGLPVEKNEDEFFATFGSPEDQGDSGEEWKKL